MKSGCKEKTKDGKGSFAFTGKDDRVEDFHCCCLYSLMENIY